MTIKSYINQCNFYPVAREEAGKMSPLLNPGAAETTHQATQSDRQCRDGISKTNYRLGEHPECAEHQFWIPPNAPSKQAAVLSDLVDNR